MRIRKDGGLGGVDPGHGNYIPSVSQATAGSAANIAIDIDAGTIEVSPGDYFELYIQYQNNPGQTTIANHAWFEMEIVE